MTCSHCHHPVYGDPLAHGIELHGVLPDRAPQRGDTVYRDGLAYVVGRARTDYPCRACQRAIQPGDLHAGTKYSLRHYCLDCATFANGTPTARAAWKARFCADGAAHAD